MRQLFTRNLMTQILTIVLTMSYVIMLTIPDCVTVFSWCKTTASVVICPSRASLIWSAVQFTGHLGSFFLYQLSGYQPIIIQTYFLPYNFSLYAWNKPIKSFDDVTLCINTNLIKKSCLKAIKIIYYSKNSLWVLYCFLV